MQKTYTNASQTDVKRSMRGHRQGLLKNAWTTLSQPALPQRLTRQRCICPHASVNPFARSTGRTPFSAASSTQSDGKTSQAVPEAAYSNHKWTWRGHTINYAVAGCGKPIILVHGFGASSGQFRKNIPVLAEKYKVFAIDLLGFGASDKPDLKYTTGVWRDQLLDFIAEFMPDKPVVLVGNSIGSLACLMANASSAPGTIRGTVLLNTAGAMNNKGVIKDWRIILAYPIFLLVDLLLSITPVARFLFEKIRSKENIRQALQNVYMNKEAVDDELVEMFYEPGASPDALPVFVSVITGPGGPSPWDLLPDVKGPMLVLWGDKDLLTPLDGPVGKLMMQLPETRPDTQFQLLTGVGHCPHDDQPDVVHEKLLPWLEAL